MPKSSKVHRKQKKGQKAPIGIFLLLFLTVLLFTTSINMAKDIRQRAQTDPNSQNTDNQNSNTSGQTNLNNQAASTGGQQGSKPIFGCLGGENCPLNSAGVEVAVTVVQVNPKTGTIKPVDGGINDLGVTPGASGNNGGSTNNSGGTNNGGANNSGSANNSGGANNSDGANNSGGCNKEKGQQIGGAIGGAAGGAVGGAIGGLAGGDGGAVGATTGGTEGSRGGRYIGGEIQCGALGGTLKSVGQTITQTTKTVIQSTQSITQTVVDGAKNVGGIIGNLFGQ